MIISYNGLWKILIDKNLQRKDLKEALKISSSTFAKMSRGETVSMDVKLLWSSIFVTLRPNFCHRAYVAP